MQEAVSPRNTSSTGSSSCSDVANLSRLQQQTQADAVKEFATHAAIEGAFPSTVAIDAVAVRH
jgi:hypothetical protein